MVAGRNAVGLLALVAGLAAVGSTTPAAAAAPLSASVVAVENHFPTEVVFKAQATSEQAAITTIRLLVAAGPASPERVIPFSFSSGSTSIVADLRYPSGSIPAGATLRYSLEVEDAAGNHFATPKSALWYADTRYEWMALREGLITVHYHAEGVGLARRVLAGAQDARGNTGMILGVQLRPFDIVLYNSPEDLLGRPEPPGGTDATRSRAYGDHALVHVIVDPDNGTPEDHARHESTHMFVAWATSQSAPAPAWLNEGFAVWSERSDADFWRRSLAEMVRRGDAPRLRTLGAFPREIYANTRSYVQGWSVVNYLIDTYGRAKFRDLFRHLEEGETGALQAVYALSLDQLDAAWRASVGLSEQSYERVRPTPVAVFGAAPALAAAATEAPPASALPWWPLAASGALALAAGIAATARQFTRSRSSSSREVSS